MSAGAASGASPLGRASNGSAQGAAGPTKRPRVEVEFDPDSYLQAHPDATPQSMILGIDEAGRGASVGSMMYGGAMVSIEDHDALVACGVADSKELDNRARETCFARMMDMPRLTCFLRRVTAEAIGESMTGRSGQSLNTISHQTAIDIVREAVLRAEGRLVAVFIDTVGSEEVYQRLVKGRFPHLHVVVRSKADARFPIVSAASVVAKEYREREVRKELGVKVGSGYPGDPEAVRFLRTNVHRFFGLPRTVPFGRHSWAPVEALFKEACVPLRFEQDDINAQLDVKQQVLTFTKQPPRRDATFTHLLGLNTTYTLEPALPRMLAPPQA